MSESLGSLLAKIGLDTSELKRGVAESKGLMGGLQGAAKGVAIGVAGIATAAVAFGAKSAATFASVGGEVMKLQRFTGGTAESMSRLRFAAQESGVDADSLAKSMGLLSKKLEAGKDGLDKYGVATKDSHGKMRPLNDVLLDTAGIFEKMPNGVEKNALAMQLFGKAGMSMVPFLNRGKAGLSDLEKEADKFGLTLTQKNLDAVKRNTMAHREFHAAMQGLQVQIGQYVLPIMTAFTTHLVGILLPTIRVIQPIIRTFSYGISALAASFKDPDITSKGFVGAMERVGMALRHAWDYVMLFVNALRTGFTEDEGTPIEHIALIIREHLLPIIKEVSEFITDHWKPILIGLGIAFAALLSPIGTLIAAVIYAYFHFKVFRDVVNEVAKGVGDTIGALVDWWKGIWPQVSEAVGHVMVVIRDVINAALTVVQFIWHAVGDDIMNYVDRIFHVIGAVIEAVMGIIRGIIQTVLALINGDWGAAWDGIKQILSSAWDGIFAIVAGVIGQLKTIIAAGLSIVHDLFFAGWEAIKDVVMGAIRFVVDQFLGMVGMIIDAAARAFGWVPGIGPKLRDAAKDFDRFRDEVNAALGGIKDKVINVSIRGVERHIDPNIGGSFDEGGEVPGPRGAPKIIIAHGGETVLTPAQMAAMVRGGGGSRPGASSTATHYHKHYAIQSEIHATGSPQELGAAAADELDWLMATRS